LHRLPDHFIHTVGRNEVGKNTDEQQSMVITAPSVPSGFSFAILTTSPIKRERFFFTTVLFIVLSAKRIPSPDIPDYLY